METFLVSSAVLAIGEFAEKPRRATVMPAAKFSATVAGTTFGMPIAEVPAIVLGEVSTGRIPFAAARHTAAARFELP